MSDVASQISALEYDNQVLRTENESLKMSNQIMQKEIDMLRELANKLEFARNNAVCRVTELNTLLHTTSIGLVDGLKRMREYERQRTEEQEAEDSLNAAENSRSKMLHPVTTLPNVNYGNANG